MADKLGTFDAQGFYEALDATRQAMRMNWKEVAALSGVSASSLTRMAQGKRPDVDSLAALVAWSGLSSDDFVIRESKPPQPQPLALIGTYLRADKQLSPESAAALTGIIAAAYEQLRKKE